ncbi:MAG: type II CAAX endopeptidase family protein [Rhizonema sp. NSF051]|nr:type II CAAX endopeptidase family protein [Rhizonema sp. NSF051]
MTPQNSNNPFLQLKVRSLLLRFVLVTIVVGIGIGLIQGFSGLKINDKLMTPIIYILVFGLLCLWVLADFNRLGINRNYVIGRLPNNQRWLPLIGLVMMMLVFSISAYLVSFYLLSLVAPSFVERLLHGVASSPTTRNTAPLLYNLLNAIVLVIAAPLAEEFLFRGIILQRWASKWGIRSALVVSSLLFGFGHANVVGLSVVGLILGVLYIKTRTLIVPIACHALNNSVVVVLTLLPSGSKTLSTTKMLERLHSDWLFGLILMALSLPVLVRFLSQNWPHKDAAIPYSINANQ